MGILDDRYLAKVFSYALCDRGSFFFFAVPGPPYRCADLIVLRRAGRPRAVTLLGIFGVSGACATSLVPLEKELSCVHRFAVRTAQSAATCAAPSVG